MKLSSLKQTSSVIACAKVPAKCSLEQSTYLQFESSDISGMLLLHKANFQPGRSIPALTCSWKNIQVKKCQAEKRLDLLVDVDLKNDYNRMELEEIVQVNWFNSPHLEASIVIPELGLCPCGLPLVSLYMVQVALLCSQTSPSERPKMSDVVRMLEGEGLVERWEKWWEAEKRRSLEAPSMPHWELIHDSSWDIEATQLSGPR
jgi:hypothetical protein